MALSDKWPVFSGSKYDPLPLCITRCKFCGYTFVTRRGDQKTCGRYECVLQLSRVEQGKLAKHRKKLRTFNCCVCGVEVTTTNPTRNTCGDKACKRERNRRTVAAYYAKNPNGTGGKKLNRQGVPRVDPKDPPKKRHCLRCGKPGPDWVCPRCASINKEIARHNTPEALLFG